MCGIAGIFSYNDSAPRVDGDELLRVREAMRSRGPDGAGLWISPDGRAGLAHRRLAVIDLSENAAQPMATSDGRLRVTFNGEIYNYRELRRDLQRDGYVFHSDSDTEVLLHLYSQRGPDMVHVLSGMYAFGIWDEVEKKLFLARDPFGVKPLYYADDGKVLRFASQVKALLKSTRVDTSPEPAGSVGFLIWGSVPEPYTLYNGVKALPAGTYLSASSAGASVRTYFDVGDELRKAEGIRPDPGSNAQVFEALVDSVRRHLVSDVQVGLFLSGGIDSTALAALAYKQQGVALHAVTLGFREFEGTAADEVPIATAVARQFGIKQHVDWISKEDFEAARGHIVEAMDQPSIDGVNTFFVSRAAAQAGMKVALSGLGGDELFGGYPSYKQVPALVRALGFARSFPAAGRLTRRILTPLLRFVTSPRYGLLEYGGSYEGAYLLRRALFMPWEVTSLLDRTTVKEGLAKLSIHSTLEATIRGLRAPRSRITALEISWYMRNQLLRDSDWSGMAHSVEIRVPFVDVRLFRQLAPLLASDDYPTKEDVVKLLPSLPREVSGHPKTGFVTPLQEWTRPPASSASRTGRGLRNWAQSLLPTLSAGFHALALVPEAFGGHGGIAKFNRDLLESLASMPGCEAAVVVPRLMPSAVGPTPPKIRLVREGAGGKLRFVWAALSSGLREPVDLLVVGHINLAPLGALIAVLRRTPSVLFIYGIDAWAAHPNVLVRYALSRFTLVVGISDLTVGRFASWSRVRPGRLRVLPVCVDLQEFRPAPKRHDLAARLGIENRTVIMTLGRLANEERFKGFDEVIEALPELINHIPDISYLICGDGNDRERLQEKAGALGLEDRVVFTGFVPEDEKADYYRLADAYVMPSRGEGFGIVLLEAMACGIPAMGSVLDGTREALMDGALGCLVDPSSPSDVVSGIQRTLARGRGQPPRLRHFSRESFGDRLDVIARELLATRAGQPLAELSTTTQQ